MRQTAFQIVHKMKGAVCASITDKPAWHKLCIRIYSYPRPNVPGALFLHAFRAIPVLGVAETPDFVALETLAAKVPKSFVLILGANAAQID